VDVLLAVFTGTLLVIGLSSRLLPRKALPPVLLVLAAGAALAPRTRWVDLSRSRLIKDLIASRRPRPR
jgi:hypothetical protein